jgi:lycopene beta-cyclase
MFDGRPDCDVLLVGAGLANGLIALEIARRRPDLAMIMVDPTGLEAAAGHTWCVFQTDLEPDGWTALQPLLARSWPAYDVVFPKLNRRLETSYGCLTGERLASRLSDLPNLTFRRDAAASVTAREVGLKGGDTLTAPLVIDGRGVRASKALELGFQKFLGVELALDRPHGLDGPIVMDAAVDQGEDYRFLYVLPLGDTRLLVEDTRYADGAALDLGVLEAAALRYAAAQGWVVSEIVRREHGVLPIALDGDIDAYWAEAGGAVAQVGLRGAFFHPTTGYSLPDGVAVARLVGESLDLGSEALAAKVRERSIRLWRERGFYRLLNRMLFRAAAPGQRYRVLQRFYALPRPLIERFYAGRTTLADKARILAGRPPVPILRAIKAAPPAPKGFHANT